MVVKPFNKTWRRLIVYTFYETEFNRVAWTHKDRLSRSTICLLIFARNSLACPVNPILWIDNFIMHEIDYRSSPNCLRPTARNWRSCESISNMKRSTSNMNRSSVYQQTILIESHEPCRILTNTHSSILHLALFVKYHLIFI